MQIAEMTERRKIWSVRVHAEIRLGNDPGATLAGELQRALNGLEIEVGNDLDAGATKAATVDQRGVVQCVADDEIPGLREGGHRPEIRGVAAGEENRAVRAKPFCERPLQQDVLRALSHDEPGCPRARRGFGRQPGCESKIVVRAERTRDLLHGFGPATEEFSLT